MKRLKFGYAIVRSRSLTPCRISVFGRKRSISSCIVTLDRTRAQPASNNFSRKKKVAKAENIIRGRRYAIGCDSTVIKSHENTAAAETKRAFSTITPKLARRKTTVSLLALPQGALSLQPLPELPRPREPQYSYVIAQARENIDRFGDCVVLTRVGGFYELYFEQAEEVGPGLGLKVGRKRGRGQGEGVPMAGFPFFQLDRFLKVLVQDMARHVAIAEEFPNPNKDEKEHASYGLLWERRVARIITPGTLIDEKFMDPWENNYLLCVWPSIDATDSSRTSPSEESGDGEGMENPVGLAWLDLSTGDFFTQSSTRGGLAAELARIGPREIVIDESCRNTPEVSFLSDEKRLLTFHTSTISPLDTASWSPLLESSFGTAAPQTLIKTGGFGEDEISAGSTLLSYVKEKLQGLSMKLQPPIRRDKKNNMLIDAVTMRALEIRATLKDGVVGGIGTLLKTVRRTVTRGGTRRLGSWLTSPETSVRVINDRLNLVEHFIASPILLDDIRYKLKLTHDSQRLVQKMSLGRGDADDLVALARTIISTQDIADCLSLRLPKKKKESLEVFRGLLARIERLEELAGRILRSIDENGLMLRHTLEDREAAEMTALVEAVEAGRMVAEEEGEEGRVEEVEEEPEEEKPKKKGRKKATTKSTAKKVAKPRSQRILKEADREKVEPWIMHPTASPTLTKLHRSLEKLMVEKQVLETQLLDESMLSEHLVALKWTPSSGHILHIKSRSLPDMTEGILATAVSVGSSKSTHSYHLPEWTKLGSRIEMARLAIRAEEQKVLQEIRKQVIMNIHALRRNAAVLDELDIGAGFAVLAKESGWVRPILNMGTEHKIVGGRHATVQRSLDDLGRTFVANDCWVGGEEGMWIITGPNMAGKSTFLRQNALISILAQTGSYVPADHAEIGIIDQIFSRVGSADDLYRSQSTFMVEMMETAYILKNATPRSFVIMDEVGRGTTVDDGFAIAGGVLKYLWEVSGCRVLFATHFHGLVELAQRWEREGGEGRKKVGAYCTDLVEDEKGGWMFVHKLRQGVNKDSHAVKVARMAGLPHLALKTAEDILARGKKKG
ncbi:DNA mismatch repair ATPase msh1 [Orbilia blumenaviensis]|uniref:DNA mismatch repair ATPase msh1 n=1 Tax=Orbilia blumenaviensis TaxID=1796055 RepID=A0AAV9UEI5_9PEZI